VVVTLDGVRWQEVFEGSDPRLDLDARSDGSALAARELMPNLYALSERGGVLLGNDQAPMTVSNTATLSLPGYLELFTGRITHCQNNDCPPTTTPTLLDAWLAHDPSATLAVLTSWSRISRAAARDYSRITLSAGKFAQSHAEAFCADDRLCRHYHAGLHAAPWPGVDDYRPDRITAALALEYLRLRRPHLLFVGLGDTDEYAHRGNYRGYLTALREADETLGKLGAWLKQKEVEGHRTFLICTADHGRASNFRHHGGAPEAARVWALFAGSVVRARGPRAAALTRLTDIAPTIREVVGLTADRQPGAGHSLLSWLAAPEPSEYLSMP
jgi:arylsulfatase A-like enzyme